MMKRIVGLKPLPGHRLALEWETGEAAEVDLSRVFRQGVFAAVRGPHAFKRAAIGERGRSVYWIDPQGDELDLCADALWRMAFEGQAIAAE